MKVRGTARIPDYVQIRDNSFTLIAYFRADRPEKELARLGLKELEAEFKRKINEIPYGKLTRIDFGK